VVKRDKGGAGAPPPATPFHNPFGRLGEKLGMAPAPPAQPERPPERSRAPERVPTRAVVRLERKGRGGKEATVVEKLDLSPAERERWAGELKRALGCGGSVEGDAIALQGDLRERVRDWLERRGVRKVTLG
jgi:translation initiation factor 1